MAPTSAIKVAVLGGGVAGMSAAHELAERGFLVDVYERQPVYVGGKARSVDVPCPIRALLAAPTCRVSTGFASFRAFTST